MMTRVATARRNDQLGEPAAVNDLLKERCESASDTGS